MTIFTVTSGANDGQGSLRQAILDANANPGLDTVIFETINVSLDSAISITDSLEITGNGATTTQTQSDRIFNIDNLNSETIDVTINNLTFTGGNTNRFGGAINNVENLTINKTTFQNNTTGKRGAAIFSDSGNLIVTDSTFRTNTISDSDENAGGAIYVSGGTVDINSSNFEENEAVGIIKVDNAEASLSNSSIINNLGTGVVASQQSTINILNSFISNNSDGGITIKNNSQLTLEMTGVVDNQSELGGGVLVTEDSTAKIADSIVSNNTATVQGGGININANSQLNVVNTTIEGNDSPVGSAIFLNNNSEAVLLDSSVNENTGSENELEGKISVETTPVVAPGEAELSTTEVHRFYQFEKGFHLYTSDTNEIATIQEQSQVGTLSYQYEGERFTVLGENRDSLTGGTILGAKPVYRFFNTDTGSHLYTMDETERNYISENLANYNAEGIQYYAFEEQPESIETVPVYRLYNNQSSSHLFTIDQGEVNYIQENLANFSLESGDGVAFHVFELETTV